MSDWRVEFYVGRVGRDTLSQRRVGRQTRHVRRSSARMSCSRLAMLWVYTTMSSSMCSLVCARGAPFKTNMANASRIGDGQLAREWSRTIARRKQGLRGGSGSAGRTTGTLATIAILEKPRTNRRNQRSSSQTIPLCDGAVVLILAHPRHPYTIDHTGNSDPTSLQCACLAPLSQTSGL